MMENITITQFVISLLGTCFALVLGIIKYVDTQTEIAKKELREEIREIKVNQNQTQSELRKINEAILEIKVFLFGAFKEPGFIQRLKDELDDDK